MLRYNCGRKDLFLLCHQQKKVTSLQLKCQVINTMPHVFCVAVGTGIVTLGKSVSTKRETLQLVSSSSSSNMSIDLWTCLRRRDHKTPPPSPPPQNNIGTTSIGQKASFRIAIVGIRSFFLKQVTALRFIISTVTESYCEIEATVQNGEIVHVDNECLFESLIDSSIRINVIGRFLPKRKHQIERSIGFAVLILGPFETKSKKILTLLLSGGACTDDCDQDRGEIDLSIQIDALSPENNVSQVSNEPLPKIVHSVVGPLVFPSTFSFAARNWDVQKCRNHDSRMPPSHSQATWILQRQMIKAAAYQVGERHLRRAQKQRVVKLSI
mmetsp:Transcript_800/g.1139  ORF Transcript_800/g.1139 Transcript_800/m.1139 type:complete len:325 (-) Transcript_800:2019-2993(-)